MLRKVCIVYRFTDTIRARNRVQEKFLV